MKAFSHQGLANARCFCTAEIEQRSRKNYWDRFPMRVEKAMRVGQSKASLGVKRPLASGVVIPLTGRAAESQVAV